MQSDIPTIYIYIPIYLYSRGSVSCRYLWISVAVFALKYFLHSSLLAPSLSGALLFCAASGGSSDMFGKEYDQIHKGLSSTGLHNLAASNIWF